MADTGTPGPGSASLPPPFGTGPALPPSTLTANLATGGWQNLTRVLARDVPLSLGKARALNLAVRSSLGRR